MSTCAMICRKDGNGMVKGVYLHFDGYPSHAGRVLRDNYTTPEAVERLIALGGLSGLEESIDSTVSYARKRGEPIEFACEMPIDEFMKTQSWGYDFVYLFDGESWTCRPGRSGQPFVGIDDAIKAYG